MSWNYRVLRRRIGSDRLGYEDEYAVYEVYYNDAGVPTACSSDSMSPHGETRQEALEDVQRYMTAFDKPVLEYADIARSPKDPDASPTT